MREWTREKGLIFDTTNCVPEPVGRFTNTLRPIRNWRTQENLPSSNEWILKGFKTLSRLSRSNSLVIEALWDVMMFAYVFNCSNSQSHPTPKIWQFDWDAITAVKYMTLLSRPFSQGAMGRVCIIRLVWAVLQHVLAVLQRFLAVLTRFLEVLQHVLAELLYCVF